MNAKKIMGAVLVALLAAALFVGAGAAASTYFAFQDGVPSPYNNSVWKNGANVVTISNGAVGPVAVPGTYTLSTDSNKKAYFTNPTATYSAVGDEPGTPYIVFNGGTAYAGQYVNVTILSESVAPNQVIVTKPSGAVTIADLGSLTYYNISNVVAGTYKVQAIWNETVGGFTTGAPLPLTDAQSFTFTVISAGDATISTAVETIFAGDVVAVTVKGVPGDKYFITSEGINATETKAAGQLVTVNKEDTGNVSFVMPNVGEVTLYLVTLGSAEDEVEIELSTSGKDFNKVVIAVVKPTLTATLGASSYFIGNDIEVTLTTDGELADAYVFNITGTNVAETQVTGAVQKDNKKDVYTVPTDMAINGKKLDVGTYTIKIYTADKKTLLATLPVALKQPFISIVEAPEVIAQGTEAKFTINAEATTAGIQYYIFGTNYFETGAQVKSVKNTPNQFVVTIDKYNTSAENMSAGQYFAVFQHPMYDGMFNINATKAGAVSLYSTTAANTLVFEKVLFNVSDRQTANAAQAICDALDSQNIDDMYVKYSFFVVGQDQSFTMSEIPTEIVKGDKLVISGVSTANKDAYVTAEMISTAFAAVPKETVGSAAFIAVTTQIAEDGTWEVTFDTSDLNVDEYSLKVACGDSTWKNVNINVVEGADKPDTPDTPDVPDTPDTPDTPTEPETPGFGALAALAGLGAVAVLLLRRE